MYVSNVTPNGSCAIACRFDLALTTFHANPNLLHGSSSTLHFRQIVTETEFEVAVVLVDTAHDLVIFRATRPASLTDIYCQLAEAMLGDEIYQIVMSVLYAPTAVEKVYVDTGVVSSTFVCPRGHSLAGPVENRGDSGGGCFSVQSDHPVRLFGLVVGNGNASITERNPISDLFFPSRTIIIPARTIISIMRSHNIVEITGSAEISRAQISDVIAPLEGGLSQTAMAAAVVDGGANLYPSIGGSLSHSMAEQMGSKPGKCKLHDEEAADEDLSVAIFRTCIRMREQKTTELSSPSGDESLMTWQKNRNIMKPK